MWIQAVFAALLIGFAQSVGAQGYPTTIAYSARLTTISGTPVTGSQNIVFSLYDVATGGTALWTESQNVNVVNGELSVALGETVPIPETTFARRLFLGIKVGNDAEMTPRPKLNSVPFAIKARSPLVRTVYVPHGGDDPAAGAALLAAVAAVPGSGALTSIHLDAGEYNLGANSLLLPASSSLVGLGHSISNVRSTHPVATITLSAQSVLDNVSVLNIGPGVAAGTDGAAAILVADGANDAKILHVGARSDGLGSVANIRNAIKIGAASNVLVQDSTIFVTGGGSLRGILANTGTGQGGLRIENVRIDAFAQAATVQAIGAYILGHQDVQIVDSFMTARGLGGSLFGAIFQGAGADVVGGRFVATGAAASSGTRTGVAVINPVFSRLRGIFINVTGVGTEMIGMEFTGNSTHGANLISASSIEVPTSSAGQLVGILGRGIAPTLTNTDIFVTGGATVTKVVGVELIPPTTGTGQQSFGGSRNRIEAFHAGSNDVGGGIVSTGPRIVQRFLEVGSTDDGIEGGVSGSGIDPQVISLRHAIINSGRSSIRKNQGWALSTHFLSVTQTMTLETGGVTTCLATSFGNQFLTNACPTP